MKNKKFLLVVFVLFLMFTLTGCANEAYMEKPLGDGFGFWDIFVYPMAGVMWCVGKTIGFGNYALTIIFSTLIVRTIAWPIYAKTNDMQLKMKLVQPEVNKLQAKYANKTDQESQRRMQMEMMNIYKKNGIGFGGCLMPFVQMPIFLGFYYAIRKLPVAMSTEGHWLNIFDSTELFGINMMLEMNPAEGTTAVYDPETQKWGVIILAILVGVTQLISIILSELRQKKAQDEQQAHIPEYRRQQNQNANAKTTANTMKFMLYFMAAMMVIFVLQSPAGLGLYWVVGNVYSTLQSWIGQLTSNKKLEKMKAKRGY